VAHKKDIETVLPARWSTTRDGSVKGILAVLKSGHAEQTANRE
jgi:hypothetical protein